MALALPALALASQPTHTTLTAETHDQAGRTQAILAVAVAGEDGQPARGAVAIEDGEKQLAGAALDKDGNARVTLDLAGGDHVLRAVYQGDGTHAGSASEPETVHAQASSTPDFAISVSKPSLSIPLGQSASVIVSIKPENNASLTAPMFITLSCQGLPDQSSCTFTPENVELLNTTLASCSSAGSANCPPTSNMVIETQLGSGKLARPGSSPGVSPVEWALVIPGALALLGLGLRRRNLLGRLALLGFAALVTLTGTTGCNSRYNYFNHGPPPVPPTPAGTYTLTISAQSNNGIVAINHTTTLVLTVQ
jgi:hypothetical protein